MIKIRLESVRENLTLQILEQDDLVKDFLKNIITKIILYFLTLLMIALLKIMVFIILINKTM